MIRLRFGAGVEQIEVNLSEQEAKELQRHLTSALAPASPLDPAAAAKAVDAARTKEAAQ